MSFKWNIIQSVSKKGDKMPIFVWILGLSIIMVIFGQSYGRIFQIIASLVFIAFFFGLFIEMYRRHSKKIRRK